VTAPYFSDNGMPGSPSAISALLQHLTQPPAMPGPQAPVSSGSPAPAPPGQVTLNGITMPAPQAAPMPQVQAPPQPPGMLDRIKGLLDPRPAAPSGYEGLLSDKEIQGAKPGVLQSLIGTPDAPSPTARYRSNLDHILELKQYAQGLSDQQTARTNARAIQSTRLQAGQMFAAKPNETPQQSAQRMMQHGLYLMGQGDEEGGAKMLNAVGQLSKVLEGPTPKEYEPKPYVDAKGAAIWVKPGEPVPPGAKPLTQATTQIRLDAAAGKADTARTDKITKDYTTQIKPLRDRAAVIDQALKTIGDAAHNPDPNVRKTLYSSAIANFIQAADQKAQIRWQLLNYYKENIDPSIGGKWELLKDRLLKGQLPGYTMEGMLTHLTGLRGMLQKEIEQQRTGLVKRHPELSLDAALPLTSEFFPEQDDSAPSAAPIKGGTDLYSKYGLTPKKP
jgi:hypothetical protein